MKSKRPTHLFYVSDYAYDKLVLKAIEQLYVAKDARRASGMSRFIEDISKVSVRDTRPEHIKRRHTEEIRTGHAPKWMTYHERRTRLLQMTPETLERYYVMAHVIGILRDDPWPIGGPNRQNPVAVTSYVLESLGLGWITPERWPLNTLEH